jgi:hypothetical protein
MRYEQWNEKLQPNETLEYDPNSGSEVEKLGANFLAQGFTDGFIAGFTYKLTGE